MKRLQIIILALFCMSMMNVRKSYKTFACTGIPFGVIVGSDGNFEASNFFQPGVINVIEQLPI